MVRHRLLKVLLAAPIALGVALLGHSSGPGGVSALGSAPGGPLGHVQPGPLRLESLGLGHLTLGHLTLGSTAEAKPRKAASKARSAGRKATKAGKASAKARKPAGSKASASKSSKSSTRKPVRHRRFAAPGQLHPHGAGHGTAGPSEMLTPVEPERAGPVPIQSSGVARRVVVPLNTEDTPLSPSERELSESLTLVVTPAGPYEPWLVQLQNTGDTVARISSDVRLLWFEATVPGKRKPVICELPGSLRPQAAYAEERVELQPRHELSFKIDPRFFCFENEDTTLLVPGTFLKPHYGWRTKTQRTWKAGKPKEVRLPQQAPFVALTPTDPTGLKELVAAGIALDDRFAEWSKTRIKQEDSLPLPAQALPLPEQEEDAADGTVPVPPGTVGSVGSAGAASGTAGTAPAPNSGLELLVVRSSDATTAGDIGVGLAVRNRGTDSQRVFLRADQLTFYVWGPDGQVQCAPPFAYRAPDAQGLTTLAPGKRLSMNVRLSEFCPSGTFARPGFYYVSADLPVLDNHDHQGRALPRADTPEASNPRVLEASFALPLRVRSGDERFSYWDVGQALQPHEYEEQGEDAAQDGEHDTLEAPGAQGASDPAAPSASLR
jgi:hypothetical protein